MGWQLRGGVAGERGVIELAPVEVPGYPASRLAPVLWALRYAFAWAPLVILNVVIWTWWIPPSQADTAREWLLVLVGALMVVIALTWVALRPVQRYRTYRWGMTDRNIGYVFSKMLWWSRLRAVDIYGVRTVELRRGLLSRFLGLASVVVRTENGGLRFDALDAEVADQVVEWLFARVDGVVVGSF